MFDNIEPRSDIRQGAVLIFEMYAAYRQAGFDDEQAMRLVTTVISAQLGGTSE